jgi:hypothetical protein
MASGIVSLAPDTTCSRGEAARWLRETCGSARSGVGEERDVVLAADQVRPPPRFQCAARELMFTLRRGYFPLSITFNELPPTRSI